MGKNQGTGRRNAGQFQPGESGNPSGRPARADHNPVLAGLANAVMAHMDAWENAGTGLGITGRDKTIATSFTADLVDSESALEIYRGDPIGARIIETIPNEAQRQGFELCIGDDEPPDTYTLEKPEAQPGALGGKPKSGNQLPKAGRGDAITRAFAQQHPSAFARRYRAAVSRARHDAGDAKPLTEAISKKLEQLQFSLIYREAMCAERSGGGSAVLIGANDYTTDLREPLDLTRVRSLDWLTPLEARELRPIYYYNDPFKPKFGQVAIYQLVPYTIGQSLDGYIPRVTQIHESRLLVLPGARVSRRIMAGGAAGWGDSVFTRVVRALRGFNSGHQNAEILLSDFAQAVYKIKGLADLMTRNRNALTDSMIAVELGRSIARAVVIDSEEEFERKSTTLAGYPETLDRLATNLASAADMPLTLLLGQSPAGMNATGASDIRFFYDRIASVQQQRVAPALLRIVEILLATMGEDPEAINYSVKFKPLWQPTEKEIADAHLAQANADAIYLDREVVSPEEMALCRFGGDQYSFETRVDFEARQAQEAVVAPTVDAKPHADPMIPDPADPMIPNPNIESHALDGPEASPTAAAPDKALNGAQVSALADIVKAVAAGELPASSAIEIIIVGFPVQREQATRMVGTGPVAPKMNPKKAE